ncbi:MAG: hypothetical protein ACOX83_05815 [Candidatus Spyradocola sp.]
MRPIDADELRKLCSRMMRDPWNDMAAPISWAKAYGDFRDDVDSIPTLTPPNDPLTWNELAEMEGQPVYIVEMGVRRYWALVIYVDKDTAYFATLNDPDDHGAKELYGESWVAYRRPKEGEGKPTEPPNV